MNTTADGFEKAGADIRDLKGKVEAVCQLLDSIQPSGADQARRQVLAEVWNALMEAGEYSAACVVTGLRALK